MAGADRSAVLVRPMTEDDLPQVQRIERLAYQDAWPSRAFRDELRNEFGHYLVAVDRTPGAEPRAMGFVDRVRRALGRDDPGRILGFAGAWYMVDQLHIVTIAVDPEEQGRGLGHLLLWECYRLALEAHLPSIVLEVRESNERAQALYERFGFRVLGRRRAYYRDNDEDAIVMETPRLDDWEQVNRVQALREELNGRYPELFDGR